MAFIITGLSVFLKIFHESLPCSAGASFPNLNASIISSAVFNCFRSLVTNAPPLISELKTFSISDIKPRN